MTPNGKRWNRLHAVRALQLRIAESKTAVFRSHAALASKTVDEGRAALHAEPIANEDAMLRLTELELRRGLLARAVVFKQHTQQQVVVAEQHEGEARRVEEQWRLRCAEEKIKAQEFAAKAEEKWQAEVARQQWLLRRVVDPRMI